MTQRLAADAAGIAEAARLLRAGGLVAFGTETVYGLGADATDAAAVAAVFEAKGRPRFNPLICHFPSGHAAWEHVTPSLLALSLAERFWPGPLTLVLPRRPESAVALLAGAGLDTLAVRVPAHPVALALLRAVGRPVAAPSANRSGRISPTTAVHVLDELAGRIAAVLDSGRCRVGVESTVLDLTGEQPSLLRPGGITLAAIERLVGRLAPARDPAIRAPGMLASHYAPLLPVRLDAVAVEPDEALLAFGPPLPSAGPVFQLSDRQDMAEAATRLFEGLRVLDASGQRGIAVMPVPESGLGQAINDRLRRSAVRG